MGAGKSQNFDAAFFKKYATPKYYLSRGASGHVYGPIQWNAMQLAIKQTTFAAGKVTEELKKDIETKKDIFASIEHKHLMRIHFVDLNQLPKSMFIVMEFAAGGSLHDALRSLRGSREKQGGSLQKLPIDVVTDWAQQIAEGMLYLHEKHLVHRDLKSSNILLMEPFEIREHTVRMTLKIADFDEVKDHDHTKTMSFVGTVAYMAPEVIVKQRFSKGSDVWSYGVVIWEMLTGDTPHKGLEPNTIMHKATKGKLKSLKIEKSFPRFWKQLLNRCLEPIVLQRASFHDVVSILQGKLKYNSDPDLIHSKETNHWITGLALLDNELFVVNLCSSDIEVYDSIELSFSRRMHLKKPIYPVDLISCSRSKCLYILNVKDFFEVFHMSDEILRVDSNATLIKNWPIGSFYGNTVSITDESNIIVCDSYYRVLKEYSPDGHLISEINLSVDAGIPYIQHAIKLSNGDFLFSYRSVYEEPHRVCIVDAVGKLKRSFSEECGPNSEQMKHPGYLSVDGNGFVWVGGKCGPNREHRPVQYSEYLAVDENGNVLVVDVGNSRVLLLDSNLKFRRVILSKEKHGLQYPWRIILDETNGRMLVAETSRILIFQINE